MTSKRRLRLYYCKVEIGGGECKHRQEEEGGRKRRLRAAVATGEEVGGGALLCCLLRATRLLCRAAGVLLLNARKKASGAGLAACEARGREERGRCSMFTVKGGALLVRLYLG